MTGQDSGARIQESGLQPGWHKWQCATCGEWRFALIFQGGKHPLPAILEMHGVSSPRCPEANIQMDKSVLSTLNFQPSTGEL